MADPASSSGCGEQQASASALLFAATPTGSETEADGHSHHAAPCGVPAEFVPGSAWCVVGPCPAAQVPWADTAKGTKSKNPGQKQRAINSAVTADIQQLQALVGNKTEIRDFAQLQAEVGEIESRAETRLQAEVERVKRTAENLEQLQYEVGKIWWYVKLLSIIISLLIGLLTVRELWSFAPQAHGRVEQPEAAPALHDFQKLGSEVCDINSSLSGAIFPATYGGMSALCLAAGDGDVELVRGFLCSLAGNVINAACFSETALLHAIGMNRTEVATEMINHDRVDINMLGQNENSALHEAVEVGNLHIAHAILNQPRFTQMNHKNVGDFSPLGMVSQFSPPSNPQLAIASAIMKDPRFVLDPDEVLNLFDP
eukprot:CAMPEP_0179219636 /NCGR_PEP_ID=MMETSP0797-20121207/5147_1 /TAXON_ID=47934 /ORGANISM="Dinophysis acuminata, Strain DAEP01" /LENGTH=370 /DNA_ID=CAMNT_0020926133 /DNA_START=50 /DNA_END=1162 /DNA_ORIENTATION=+